MTHLSNTLMLLLKKMSIHPAMHESTPQSAHGMFVAYATVVLHESLQIPFRDAEREIIRLLQIVTRDILDSKCTPILLCDESFPENVRSFDAFRTRSQQFLELLEARLASEEE